MMTIKLVVSLSGLRLSTKTFGTVVFKRTFECNNEGKAIEEALYQRDKGLSDNWIFKYNKQEKMIELLWYQADGSLGS